MVSDRKTEIDLDGPGGKAKPSMLSEKLELVMSYTPVEQVDPYGITTMKAMCESARVTRKSSSGKVSVADVAEDLAGRSFNFTISPTGKVLDYSEMDALVFELGNRSIIDSGRQGRIKRPDMVADFVALQRHLWDPIASVDQGLQGVKDGQQWKTLENIPLPVPIRATKETTYTLAAAAEQVDPKGADKKVEIRSTFVLSDEKIFDWPRLYEGNFRMQGTVGFLRNYRFKSLEGIGVQIYNVDAGVVENDEQEYRVLMEASFMMKLGDISPVITVDQKLKTEILTE
jgi:hypothetical protein